MQNRIRKFLHLKPKQKQQTSKVARSNSNPSLQPTTSKSVIEDIFTGLSETRLYAELNKQGKLKQAKDKVKDRGKRTVRFADENYGGLGIDFHLDTSTHQRHEFVKRAFKIDDVEKTAEVSDVHALSKLAEAYNPKTERVFNIHKHLSKYTICLALLAQQNKDMASKEKALKALKEVYERTQFKRRPESTAILAMVQKELSMRPIFEEDSFQNGLSHNESKVEVVEKYKSEPVLNSDPEPAKTLSPTSPTEKRVEEHSVSPVKTNVVEETRTEVNKISEKMSPKLTVVSKNSEHDYSAEKTGNLSSVKSEPVITIETNSSPVKSKSAPIETVTASVDSTIKTTVSSLSPTESSVVNFSSAKSLPGYPEKLGNEYGNPEVIKLVNALRRILLDNILLWQSKVTGEVNFFGNHVHLFGGARIENPNHKGQFVYVPTGIAKMINKLPDHEVNDLAEANVVLQQMCSTAFERKQLGDRNTVRFDETKEIYNLLVNLTAQYDPKKDMKKVKAANVTVEDSKVTQAVVSEVYALFNQQSHHKKTCHQ